jgi:hypothetical protein
MFRHSPQLTVENLASFYFIRKLTKVSMLFYVFSENTRDFSREMNQLRSGAWVYPRTWPTYVMHILQNITRISAKSLQHMLKYCWGDLIHGRGYVYAIQYHIVWCVKYRWTVFLLVECKPQHYFESTERCFGKKNVSIAPRVKVKT